jgi:signal transduction histidine kinase
MMPNKPIVLLVDDRPENLTALEAVLSPLDIHLQNALGAEPALRFLLDNDVALVLLDVQMPGMDGFETARLIRQRRRSQNTPIIFVTAVDTSDQGVREGYKLGAVDYIVKPFEPDILRWKVSVFVDLFRSREQERLLAQEQTIRAEAEGAARRASLLADSGKALSSSMDENRILDRLARRLVPEFADGAALFRPDSDSDGTLRLISVFPDDGFVPPEGIIIESRTHPIGKAFHDGHPVLLERLAEDASQSGLFLPLCGSQKTLGVLAMYRTRPQRFEAADYAFALELCDRIMLAMTNVALYRSSEQANRAKDQFLAMVSHELRTPLVSILGWTNILLSRKLEASAAEKAIRVIEKNAKLQNELISDILDFSSIKSRRFSLECQDVEVTEIIEQAVETLLPVAQEKGIDIVKSIADGNAVVEGDPTRLQQLLTNLLANAVKFTPGGGTVTVSLESPPDSVTVRVQDTGIGIEAEFLARIFDPFVQVDTSNNRKYHGLGLGLAIVRRLTELHRGTVEASSGGLGQGTTFIVTLPSKRSASRATRP